MSSLEQQAQRRLTVLFGSQTGCASELADRLGRDAIRRGFSPFVCSMDDYDIASRLDDEQLMIFVASTTGDGDAPDNMRRFWRFLLRKAIPADALSHVQVACFGLGDSNYTRYNEVARKLRNRMVLQLGAQEIVPRGLGDDQSPNGLAGDFDAWRALLWDAVLAKFPPPPGLMIDDSPRPKVLNYRSTVTPALANSNELAMPTTGVFFAPPVGTRQRISTSSPTTRGTETEIGPEPLLATVISNTRLTSESWEQDVRHLELTLPEGSTYEAGDILDMYPVNTFDMSVFLTRLGVAENDLVHTNCPDLVPECTVKQLFTQFLDVLGTPKRTFLEDLSFFADNTEEAEKLLELASPEGNDLYHSYCVQEHRAFVELLPDFPSCKPTIGFLIEALPRLKPRSYSISSSPTHHGITTVHLTIALVKFLTPWKRIKRGICSTFVDTLEPGAIVCCWVRAGLLRLPVSHTAPMLLVGPGTGVAPMRSLLYERLSGQHDVGQVRLYFGCRKEADDYLYGDEWTVLARNPSEKVSDDEVSTQHADVGVDNIVRKDSRFVIRRAFSRDQEHKVYVMVRLAQDGARICEALLDKGGVMYVAGSAQRMPSDVKETLLQQLVKHRSLERVQAEAVVRRLVKEGRFVVEAWA